MKQHLREILGPDSLIPFENMGITSAQRNEEIASIDSIKLRLDEEHLQLFIDSVLLNSEDHPDLQSLLLQGVMVF